MAKPIPLPLGLQSSPGRTGHDSGGRLINAYAEKADDNGKAVWPVWAIEGLRAFATLADGGAVRGMLLMSPYAYVVAGTNVYRVSQGGGVLNIGSFPGSAPVYMARNRKPSTPQIALASEGLRYLIENDTVATIADVHLPNAIAVTQLDGYMVWAIADGRFFWSTIDEATAIDPADFATAEASPDGLNAIYTRGSELILFGTTSIEFWASTGAPFARIPGTLLRNLGLLSRYSVRDLNDVVFFIASDGTVRRLNGYSPERVSNHDVERAIDGVEDKATITARAYSIRGHQFYVISSADWTWAFDATSGLWHERQSYGETRWRAEAFVDLEGVRVVGDFESGLLYEVDPDTFDEAGAHLVMTIRTPPVHAYPNRLLFNTLYLDLIPGTGLNSGDDHDDDPQAMLRWSDNGSKSWSNQRTASVGAQGEFSRRVKFDQLGETKQAGRVFEISMSAAVVRGLMGGALDAELLVP
jgi:hypothetical protein